MSHRAGCLFVILVLFPMSIAFGQAPLPEALPTVAIDRELHFQTGEGAAVVIVPGVYSVAALPSGLQLIHQRVNFPFSVSALPTTHQENVTRPSALLIAGDPDSLHIVLLLPGGKALDAIGYLSARLRDVPPPVLESSRITAAFLKQGAGQVVPPQVVPPQVVPPQVVPPSVSSVPSSPAVTAESQRLEAEKAKAKAEAEMQRLEAEKAKAKAELDPQALLARIKALESVLACLYVDGVRGLTPAFPPPAKFGPAETPDVRWNGMKCPGK